MSCVARARLTRQYAFETQVAHHGLDLDTALVPLQPREGEHLLRTEDILAAIEREGDTLALVMFSGIQYYTGQLFDMRTITAAGQRAGAIVGWDLAHAAGNVPLEVRVARVEVWPDVVSFTTLEQILRFGALISTSTRAPAASRACSFTASTPSPTPPPCLDSLVGTAISLRRGSVRRRAVSRIDTADMDPGFKPAPGAAGWVQSCTPALLMAALLGSLQVFEQAGGIAVRLARSPPSDLAQPLRRKSIMLTGYLEHLLHSSAYYHDGPTSTVPRDRPSMTILTPRDPEARGAQLSILFQPIGSGAMMQVFTGLKRRGVTGDRRKPDVIRLAPVPSYTSFADVRRAFDALEAALAEVKL